MTTLFSATDSVAAPKPEGLLRPLRRRMALILSVQALLQTAAWLLLLWLGGLLLLAAGVPTAWLRYALWFGGLCATAAAIYRFFIYPFRLFGNRPAALARIVEEQESVSDNLPSIAVELHGTQDRLTDPATKALAQVAVSRGLARLAAVRKEVVLPTRVLTPSMATALFLLCLAAASAWLWPMGAGSLWSAVSNLPGSGVLTDGRVAFMVGDITLTYDYPAHTGLASQTLPGSAGDIEALKGTKVTLEIRTDKDYDEAQLVFDKGPALALKQVERARFKGSFTLSEETPYHFVLDDTRDAVERQLTVIPDRIPSVKVVAPPAELEVRDTDTVSVGYEASDDFGLSSLTLVFDYDDGAGGRATKRLPLDAPVGVAVTGGAYQWELASVNLVPGDRVNWRIEAADNDGIDGPKVGMSDTRVLLVYSMRGHHEKVLAKQEELFERLLTFLADLLETPAASAEQAAAALTKGQAGDLVKRDQAGLADVNALLKDLVTMMVQDPLTPDFILGTFKEMSALYEGLSFRIASQPAATWAEGMDASTEEEERKTAAPLWWRSITASFEQEIIRQIEMDLIKLEDLLKKQQYDSLVALSEEIKRNQEELAKLLELYKQTGDKAVKQQLMARIAAMKEKLQRLMQEMAKLSKSLPEGFVNMDAVRKDAESDSLEKMEKALDGDDLDKALAELDSFAKNLEQMLAEMKEGSKNLGEQMFSEDLAKIGQFMRDLEDLEQRQNQVANRSETIAKDISERMRAQMKERLKQFKDELKKEIAALKRQAQALDVNEFPILLPRIEGLRQQARYLDELVDADDLATAREVAAQAHQAARGLVNDFSFTGFNGQPPPETRHSANRRNAEAAEQTAGRIEALLERILPDPARFADEEQRQELQRLGKTQESLEQDAMRMEQRFNEMMQEIPGLPPSGASGMQQARTSMGEGRDRMQQGDGVRGSRQARSAQQSLKQVRNGMEQAMQGMQQGQGYAGARSMPRPGGRQSGPGGNVDTEKVKIPSAGDYQVPSELREDLLKSMKEASPKKYKQQNKNYYQGLIR